MYFPKPNRDIFSRFPCIFPCYGRVAGRDWFSRCYLAHHIVICGEIDRPDSTQSGHSRAPERCGRRRLSRRPFCVSRLWCIGRGHLIVLHILLFGVVLAIVRRRTDLGRRGRWRSLHWKWASGFDRCSDTAIVNALFKVRSGDRRWRRCWSHLSGGWSGGA